MKKAYPKLSLCGALLILVAGRPADLGNPRARTVLIVDSAEFMAEIDATASGDGIATIRCYKGCDPKLQLRETVDYHPFSISPLDVGAPNYVATTWASGTAFIARIYRVDLRSIRFVQEFYSYHIPIYGVVDRGRFVVVCQGGFWRTCKNVTYYFDKKKVVRVPEFVKQR